MKRINLLFYSILLSGCALSPGMNFESKNINGIKKFMEGYVDKYIEVKTISSELIVSDMKTNEISIDSVLLNYEPDEYTIEAEMFYQFQYGVQKNSFQEMLSQVVHMLIELLGMMEQYFTHMLGMLMLMENQENKLDLRYLRVFQNYLSMFKLM